jgi:hypothetical protein
MTATRPRLHHRRPPRAPTHLVDRNANLCNVFRYVIDDGLDGSLVDNRILDDRVGKPLDNGLLDNRVVDQFLNRRDRKRNLDLRHPLVDQGLVDNPFIDYRVGDDFVDRCRDQLRFRRPARQSDDRAAPAPPPPARPRRPQLVDRNYLGNIFGNRSTASSSTPSATTVSTTSSSTTGSSATELVDVVDQAAIAQVPARRRPIDDRAARGSSTADVNDSTSALPQQAGGSLADNLLDDESQPAPRQPAHPALLR